MRIERESLVAEDIESDYFNNKILWHIVISLAAIVAVANIAPHLASSMLSLPSTGSADNTPERFRPAFILLLLAGAVGGILSRLTQALRPAASPAERGLSWMAMFLSPLVGALAGWAGCMLLLSAHELGLVIPNVKGSQLGALLASAAVLFGFSERMFTGIAEALQNKVLAERTANAKSGEGGEDTSAVTKTMPAL
jgi:hypothetical protein